MHTEKICENDIEKGFFYENKKSYKGIQKILDKKYQFRVPFQKHVYE